MVVVVGRRLMMLLLLLGGCGCEREEEKESLLYSSSDAKTSCCRSYEARTFPTASWMIHNHPLALLGRNECDFFPYGQKLDGDWSFLRYSSRDSLLAGDKFLCSNVLSVPVREKVSGLFEALVLLCFLLSLLLCYLPLLLSCIWRDTDRTKKKELPVLG